MSRGLCPLSQVSSSLAFSVDGVRVCGRDGVRVRDSDGMKVCTVCVFVCSGSVKRHKSDIYSYIPAGPLTFRSTKELSCQPFSVG